MSKDVIEFYEKEREKHEYNIKRFEELTLKTNELLAETKKSSQIEILLEQLRDYKNAKEINQYRLRKVNDLLLTLKNEPNKIYCDWCGKVCNGKLTIWKGYVKCFECNERHWEEKIKQLKNETNN